MKIDDKILIVPDVHGRKFWKRALEFSGRIVFLGDYLDPYQFEFDPDGKEQTDFDGEIVNFNYINENLRPSAIDNFKEILAFASDNKGRVTLLTGNHDLHYIYTGQNASRQDFHNWGLIHGLFDGEKDLFKRAIQIGNLLLTHAGVSKEWLAWIKNKGLYKDDALNIADAINAIKDIGPIVTTSWYRGGYDSYSGPVWLDYHEIGNSVSMPDDVAQVFAHTMVAQEGKVTKDDVDSCWASIDSRRCFTINPYLAKPNDIIRTLEVF